VVLSHLLETLSQILDGSRGSSMPLSIHWIILSCPSRMMKTGQHTFLGFKNFKDPQPSHPWLPQSLVDFSTWFQQTSGLLTEVSAATKRDWMPLFDPIGVNSIWVSFNLFVVTASSLNHKETPSQNCLAFLSVLCFTLHETYMNAFARRNSSSFPPDVDLVPRAFVEPLLAVVFFLLRQQAKLRVFPPPLLCFSQFCRCHICWSFRLTVLFIPITSSNVIIIRGHVVKINDLLQGKTRCNVIPKVT
jgi:hypothetical protein